MSTPENDNVGPGLESTLNSTPNEKRAIEGEVLSNTGAAKVKPKITVMFGTELDQSTTIFGKPIEVTDFKMRITPETK